MTTAVIWDERYTEHIMGVFHPESPARLWNIKEVLDNDPIGKSCLKIDPREATFEEISWIHDPVYIEQIQATEGKKEVMLDADTSTSPLSWEAAKLAAGGVMVCVDAVMDKKASNAFAFIRPPGHHAERDHAMGFCIFNNVAIAAEYAIRKRGLKKVVIVDIDVHHGNGTQHAFDHRSDVLYISTHRFPFYPGTGSRSELGAGEGKGYTLNVPMHVGSGDAEFVNAFSHEVIPKIEWFEPDMIFVSAGFDIHERDPIGGMLVTTSGIEWIVRTLVETAKKVCQGRVVFVLEGGYNLSVLRECVKVTLQAME